MDREVELLLVVADGSEERAAELVADMPSDVMRRLRGTIVKLDALLHEEQRHRGLV